LKSLAGIFWAGEERGFPAPVAATGLKIGNTDLAITGFDLFVIGVVFLTLVLTTIFFTRTGMGLAMRASALNPEVTRLSGIRVGSVRTLSWAISGTASSLAGLLVTPKTNLSPNTLDLLLIVGFTAAVVGGLTSLAGSVLGGFILGYVIAFVNVYSAPENVFLAILIFLLLALFLRPQGILGSKEVRRV
jgi:branched-chain amino acid transport system permease protein